MMKAKLGPIFYGLPNHIKIGDIAIYFGRRGFPPTEDNIVEIRVCEEKTGKILFERKFEP